ncbi:hypothetical protein [Amycolatopsis anabasis]|uniref:hypothetical protein n=1 Tax=Amycolatopsis anabasis TaxID=1840409 RepID=UPI00131D649C|nr:hypothetical protein [Amycolatopsis anabasis]
MIAKTNSDTELRAARPSEQIIPDYLADALEWLAHRMTRSGRDTLLSKLLTHYSELLIDIARAIREPDPRLAAARSRRVASEGGESALLGWVIRLLPAHERSRYREEISAELYDLRDEPRRLRIAYTLRLCTRAFGLRRALRQPVPERMR